MMLPQPSFPQVDTDSRFDGVTITLGEWYEMKFYQPFDDESWRFTPVYSEEQYKRLCQRFIDRFYYREVAHTLPAQWKRAYLRKFNEIMPKYLSLYKRLEDGLNPFQTARDTEKSREIFSEFPETMLSGNSDYASTGNDRQADNVHEGPLAEMAMQFHRRYVDVDAMILDEVEHTLFTGLIVTTLPRW